MKTFLKIADFDYDLPFELIAQTPPEDRTAARLLIVDRTKGTLHHAHIRDLPTFLGPSDVLVLNQTKVFPARLKGKLEGKPIEILLHRPINEATWECLTKPGKRFQIGRKIDFEGMSAIVTKINEDGSRNVTFNKKGQELEQWVDQNGETPLPPYIKQNTAPSARYQTVYAQHRGSVAAPTAGLHFTPDLLQKLTESGTQEFFVTLHVGRGTFEPVKAENIADHVMHSEWFDMDATTAKALNKAKNKGKRLIAVGTTSARVLESTYEPQGFTAQQGETRLFITPGYTFQALGGLLTNFHLPKSTLLMLVSAFAGKELIDRAYREAIQKKYRFFSFGDAMLIL